MAFVPQREHDVFVSYAHVDNVEMAGQRWVSDLVDALTKRLEQTLGVSTGTVRVWMDHAIDGSQPLTEQLLQSIDRAATLLCVVSEGYLNSKWCELEWHSFLAKRQREGGRVYLVKIHKIGMEALPLEVRELPGYPFWRINPETKLAYTVGGPADPAGEREIYRQLETLKHDLANDLRRLRATEATVVTQGPPPAAPSGELNSKCVYLAEVTDDLRELREGVRTYLEQHSALVLPSQWYVHRDPQAYAAAVSADLERTQSFIQLLGPSRGSKRSDQLPLGLPGLQYELARAAGKSMHRWRSRELDLSDLVEDWRQWISAPDVKACPIEEFKALVLRSLKPRPAEPAAAAGKVVFVISERADKEVADELVSELKTLEVIAFRPDFDQQSTAQYKQEYRRLLSACHGLILVYGQSGVQWVRRQFMEMIRLLPNRRQPVRGQALGDAPPRGKPELGIGFPKSFRLINCIDGIDQKALSDFVLSLGD